MGVDFDSNSYGNESKREIDFCGNNQIINFTMRRKETEVHIGGEIFSQIVILMVHKSLQSWCEWRCVC